MDLYDVGMAAGEPKLKPHRKVASVAVLNGDSILMGIRRDTRELTLPGGHIESGETPEEGAERELHEETGLRVGRLESMGSEAVQVRNGDIVLVYAFKCVSAGTPVTFLDPDNEVKDWVWVPIGDGGLDPVIIENLYSKQNIVLKKLGLQDFPAIDIQRHVIKAFGLVVKAKGDVQAGHKYIRRKGAPGNYTYVYKEGSTHRVVSGTYTPPAEEWVRTNEPVRNSYRETGLETHEQQIRFLKELARVKEINFKRDVPNDMKLFHLRAVAESMQDIASITGVPTNILSYNGRLTLNIKAASRGTALAHYNSDETEITVDQSRGVGTVAHEWMHFLDNVLWRIMTKSPETGAGQRGFLSAAVHGTFATTTGLLMKVGPELAAKYEPMRVAMKELMDRFEATHVVRMRQHPEWAGMSMQNKNYYLTPTEQLARGFERFMKDRAKEIGIENRYMVGVRADSDWRWPKSDEVKDNYQKLFDALTSSAELLSKSMGRLPSMKMKLL